jgi:protein TIF31
MESSEATLTSPETSADLSLTNSVEVAEMTNSQMQESFPMVNFNMVMPHGEAITLNSVSLMENISFLKQSLSEYYESCGYTCFSFEFRPENGEAPFLLSDFAELNAYFSNFAEQTLNLHIIPQLYDAKSARFHVKRTREILSYPPQIKGLSSRSKVEAPEVAKEKTLEEMKAEIERVKAALPTDGEIFKPHNVSLKDYYQEVLYRVSENPDSISQNSSSPSDLIRSIFFSGWNPPPPQRRLRGDLFYLEVQFNIPNTPPLHLTAINNGFYVNKSTTATFDPTPAAPANFSHELLDTLIASSPALAQAWIEVSRKIDDQTIKSINEIEEDIVCSRANALESVAALYAQGRGDLVAQVPEWTSRPIEGARRNKNITYDMSRSQDDLADCFGMDEKGALREWYLILAVFSSHNMQE